MTISLCMSTTRGTSDIWYGGCRNCVSEVQLKGVLVDESLLAATTYVCSIFFLQTHSRPKRPTLVTSQCFLGFKMFSAAACVLGDGLVCTDFFDHGLLCADLFLVHAVLNQTFFVIKNQKRNWSLLRFMFGLGSLTCLISCACTRFLSSCARTRFLFLPLGLKYHMCKHTYLGLQTFLRFSK